jgi:hypothetical protein
MTEDNFRKLERGDIVRNKYDDQTYVVTENYGGRATAVTSVDMTNPPEWVLLKKANHMRIDDYG